MNAEIPKPKKKFKGFTPIFQNPKKKNVKREPPKKPFTGFSEFYKKIKDYEIYDDDDDYDSLFDAYLPKKEVLKIQEKIEEPPPPPDKHFKPQKYFEWCKERSKEAFDSYAEEEGDAAHNEENDENERTGSIKANSLVMDIKRSSAIRKYDNYRKPYDQSTLDNLSQTADDSDINPWFRSMLNKCQNVNTSGENRVQLEGPEVDDGLRNIYEKLNAREKLEFNDELTRKVNTYPYDFQFKFLNKRMKIFLQRTTRAENLDDARSDDASMSGSGIPNPWNSNDDFPCQKKELEIYFNKLTKPKREINFQQEDFKSWYTKMSFNYDRRFKDFNKNITPEQEDFNVWMAKNTEKLNKKYNEEFSKAMMDLKQRRPLKNYMHRDRSQDCLKEDFPSDMSKCNWSTSNVSSCRSIIEKLQ